MVQELCSQIYIFSPSWSGTRATFDMHVMLKDLFPDLPESTKMYLGDVPDEVTQSTLNTISTLNRGITYLWYGPSPLPRKNLHPVGFFSVNKAQLLKVLL